MTRTIEYILVAALLAVGLTGSLAHYEAHLAAQAIENQEVAQR